MNLTRVRLHVRTYFIGASALAYLGQVMAGHGHPALLTAVAALTGLAVTARAHQWVLLLILLHIGAWLLGPSPTTTTQWLSAVTTSVGLFATHTMAQWLPWAPTKPHAGPRLRTHLTTPIALAAGTAALVATLTGSPLQAHGWGGLTAGASLTTIAAVSLYQRFQHRGAA